MTEAMVILKEMSDRGIEVQRDGDRLRFRPASAMPPDLADRLRTHKAEILAALRYETSDGWTRPDWIERLRYLAGICIHAGRAQELREWADGLDALPKEVNCDGAA